MTERPDGAPAQPQDQPSATPPGPPGQPGAESHAQPPAPTPTQPALPSPVHAQPPAQPQYPSAVPPQPGQAQAQPQLPSAVQPQPAPSAYPYPNPQPPAGYGPPAAPIPTQQHPYGQPPGGGYPVAPPATSGAGRAVLWVVLGAALASAAWAGGVFLLGRDDTEADLRGYQAKSELCSSVDYSSFKDEYPEEDDSPVDHALEHEALDQSYCSISLKKSSASTLSDAYFSVQVDLHKKTDPGPEFTALWSEYDQRYDDYDVEKVSGFGDEAYVVTEDTTSGDDTSGSRAATLAVRDGWMTYEMSWSGYASSYDDVTLPEVDDVVEWLKTDTNSTLENLRSSDGI
ncbi:hypothetical protein PV416_18465 [Streptomyces ipomoeae]|uniref:hypothetical protein n=1 Tax=Streptomyces ipomoeae TaxID=103232 RepID=UPI0029A79C3E|nr:hypothetical protein [Streptomyces ipomoeae]MDX2823040.1 hypothetical protein [Streptomyces ipomoeae]